MTAFEEMGILPEIGKAVEEMDWLLPTDIQSEAIPLILGGGDVLMAAETGSGKTGAFCLPVVQIVYESNYNKGKSKASGGNDEDRWRLSARDRDQNLSLNPVGLEAQSKTQYWAGCRSNKGVRKVGYLRILVETSTVNAKLKC